MNEESVRDIISKAFEKLKSDNGCVKPELRIEIRDSDFARALPDNPEEASRVIMKIKAEEIDDEVQEVLEKYKQYKLSE